MTGSELEHQREDNLDAETFKSIRNSWKLQAHASLLP